MSITVKNNIKWVGKIDWDSLVVVGLHENWTLAPRFQVSVGNKREPA